MDKINLELINNLTEKEIFLVSELLKIKKESEEAFMIIKEQVKFSIGQNIVTIWDDGNNTEKVTHNGVWQARYLHQSYDVDCTIEGIFNIYKASCLERLNPTHRRNNDAEAAGYFRSFVRGLTNE